MGVITVFIFRILNLQNLDTVFSIFPLYRAISKKLWPRRPYGATQKCCCKPKSFQLYIPRNNDHAKFRIYKTLHRTHGERANSICVSHLQTLVLRHFFPQKTNVLQRSVTTLDKDKIRATPFYCNV